VALPKEFLPLQFAALKLFGQLVNLKDGPIIVQNEVLSEGKDGLSTHVLQLIIAAGGT
jgi:hypothetical protein